jgi:uncharacterized protein YlzI (FlbEa/FlbD family)
MKNFIKLTKQDGKSLYLNPNYIQSIEEVDSINSKESYTYITMGFGSSITYRVTESDETIVKMIEKQKNFGTISNYGADNLH